MTEGLFRVSVTIKKQVNDDHYGSETLEVSYDSESMDDDDDRSARSEELFRLAREVIMAELNRSPSEAVRRNALSAAA